MPIPDGPRKPFRPAVFPTVPLRVLSLWQERVLAVLARSRGPMSRTMIHQVCRDKYGLGGRWLTAILWAIGRTDPDKRKKFEESDIGGRQPSLLTLGYVEEREYDIDGVSEIGVKITPTGREILRMTEELRAKKGIEPILPESPVVVTDDDIPAARVLD